MDKKAALANIAKKGKVEVATLEKELTEIIEVMPPTADREALALRELNNRYSGPPDNTGKFDVCIVALYKLGDFSAKTIKAAIDAYNRDNEAALDGEIVKIIDGEVVALDRQESINYGKGDTKNLNFGKPLEHSYTRDVLALVRPEGETNYALSTITLRNDLAVSSLPAMYKLLKVNLLGSIAAGLKSAKSTKFAPSDESIDFSAQLQSLAKDKIFMLGDCFEEAKKHNKDDKGYYERFVITSGDCKFMNDPKNAGGNYNGTFDDFTTDQMVSAFVEPALGKPEIGQTYTLIAQTAIKKGWDKETKSNTDEDILVMNVMGYYS